VADGWRLPAGCQAAGHELPVAEVVQVGGWPALAGTQRLGQEDHQAKGQANQRSGALSRSAPHRCLAFTQPGHPRHHRFQTNNLQAVKDTPSLPAGRVRKAIATCVFEGGGRKYPCENEVNEATNLLLNRISDTYQRIAGGALNWDAIILTGGGSGLLYQRLLPILEHERVILADDLDTIHLANVRGGLKLWRLYEALKLV
jgi:hypothetical protein